MFSTLLDAFLAQVHRHPHAIALIADADRRRNESVTLTWRQLAAVTAVVAEQLEHRLGRSPERPRHVGHASDNTLSDVILALASMSLAAVEVPIDHRLDSAATEALWNRVGGLWLDADRSHRLVQDAMRDAGTAGDPTEHLRRLRPGIEPGAPALILWTSGTTAEPKGVMLSHRSLHLNAAAKLAAVPQRAGDLRLTALPLSHAYARTCDLGTWLLSGCRLAITLGWEGWCRLAPRVQPTLTNTVPSLAGRLFDGDAAELGTGGLRLLGCGGAAMGTEAFGGWQRRGVTVIQGYGLTEAAPVICSATPDDARPGLVGRPVDGWQTDLRGGRLRVRGPHLMLGYWSDPAATAERIDAGGWLDTGDLVERDAGTGQFRILGRADDVIVLANGNKVHPIAIERAAGCIAGIRHALLREDQGQLELWLDTEREVDKQLREEIDAALAETLKWQRPRRVRRFDPALSVATGELTPKGTPRRQAIVQRRFR